jgi:RNA polymerase sigma-70 factor (ECF subfamily)
VSGSPEVALLDAARAGDTAALEALIERHQSRVFRFATRMCRNSEDARDVLQETLLAMARTIGRFRGESSVSTWLFAIARSFCLKSRRRRSGAPAEVLSIEAEAREATLALADEAPGPDRAVERREVASAVGAALDLLDPKHREVLLLRDMEELTAPEVAEVLGLSVEAVKSRLHRARTALRERLRPLLEDGGRVCPDTLATLSRHLEGEIGPAQCADMERHLAACPGCKTACEALRRALVACRQIEAPRVPPDLDRSIRARVRHLAAERG